MDNLIVFNNKDFGDVRVLKIDDEPWFVGKDVATILGYSNINKAVQMHVDDEDKKVVDFKGFSQNGTTLSGLWGANDFSDKTLVNESGLYSLIFSSKLPKAKEFKRWVTAEVLPSIRKNGAYIAGQEELSDIDLLAKAILAANNIINQRDKKIAEQAKQIEALTPKASYYDIVLQCKELLTITQIAKDFGMTGHALNEYLNIQHVQYKRGSQWVLYHEHDGEGYAQSSTYVYYDNGDRPHSSSLLKWTQKGRLMIYELLKKDNILPVCERQTA